MSRLRSCIGTRVNHAIDRAAVKRDGVYILQTNSSAQWGVGKFNTTGNPVGLDPKLSAGTGVDKSAAEPQSRVVSGDVGRSE